MIIIITISTSGLSAFPSLILRRTKSVFRANAHSLMTWTFLPRVTVTVRINMSGMVDPS
jgi:hypothetical protein